MKITKKTLLPLAFLSVVLTSCVSKKEIIYFQENSTNDKTQEIEYLQNYFEKAPTFQPNDKLSIIVTSSKYLDDKQEKDFTEKYNLEYSLNKNPNSTKLHYVVSKDGIINIPNIEPYKISGKNKFEAAEEIKKLVLNQILAENKFSKDYINDILVNIEYLNFRINILGEVNKPGNYTISDDRLSIIDAIGLANDLTIEGKRNNVKLIRENNGKISIKKIDLTDASLFESEHFYLKQNDIVYVEPNKTKIQSSKFNYSLFLSVAGIIISVISVLSK